MKRKQEPTSNIESSKNVVFNAVDTGIKIDGLYSQRLIMALAARLGEDFYLSLADYGLDLPAGPIRDFMDSYFKACAQNLKDKSKQ